MMARASSEVLSSAACACCGGYEKVRSEELPYLFQTVFSASPRALSSTIVWNSLLRPGGLAAT
jgi:hypothetical protein